MDALMICTAVLALVGLGALVWRRWRARSDQRLQWQGTRERDWTVDELDALRARDAAA
ncbi:MAG TPA: hypothetical protein VF228_14715 [Iamia sp.]